MVTSQLAPDVIRIWEDYGMDSPLPGEFSYCGSFVMDIDNLFSCRTKKSVYFPVFFLSARQ